MATTPQHTGQRIDEAIDSLNAQWDLGLPRLHGADADRADKKGLVAERCSNRIRFLCYKTDNIDALLADFAERARQIYSEWVFKPSQERGTLPILPQTRSLVQRDFLLKQKSGVVQLSDSQRLRLQQLLFQILDENSELARIALSFSTEQASTTSFITAPSTPERQIINRKQKITTKGSRRSLRASETVIRETGIIESEEPELKDPMTKSTKRTLGSPEGVSLTFKPAVMYTYKWSQRNKRPQRQQTLSQVWLQPPPPPPQPRNAPQIAPEPISFESAPSPGASPVFSAAEDGEGFASNDTSMISTQTDNTQDLLPTQDANELDQDEDFQRSFSEACHTSFDPTDLLRNTPFKMQASLPREAPFWYSWEVHRLAPFTGLKPIDLERKIRLSDTKAEFSGERLWDTVKQSAIQKDSRSLPSKSDLSMWTTSKNKYWDEQTNKVAYFTAVLEWNDNPSQGLFQLKLNPIQFEQSCRLHRKFGADRFIVVTTPLFSKPPANLKSLDKDSVPLHRKITDFLASNSHFIAGRYWRTCFVEEEKKKRRLKKSAPKRIKIVLFAETGYDIIQPPLSNLGVFSLRADTQHQEIMLEQLMQWHIPFEANRTSTDLKLFSRWSLGFSKTISTLELYPHEFLSLADSLGDEPVKEPGGLLAHQVMNDGCALVSYPLAKAIWTAYGGEGEIPSAIQGRISGAKGLWIVDYQGRFPDVSKRGFWIQVSDSQLKIKPHPAERLDADASQRTFEVLKFAQDCREAQLNKQLITIVEDRGVPRRVVTTALEEDVKSYSDSLIQAMDDPRRLRLWMQEHGYSSPSDHPIILGSFPDSARHQMTLLLDSGFHPSNCERLVLCAADLLKLHMDGYLEKMWIHLPHSTTVFCAPDPCDVLAEGEVFLGFSKPVIDPRTGITEAALEDIGVLLARNPAHLASDIQLRKAVYKHELRNYKNVVLFSTKGNRSTASLLSGGDFDGDTVTCIWDPKFVEHFRNAPLPEMPAQSECSMVNKSRQLSEIFPAGRFEAHGLENFLRECVAFNANEDLLGKCTYEWEKLVYSLSGRQQVLSTTGTIRLAALAGYLVDSCKQGWSISQEAWHTLRNRASGSRKLDDPGYKTGEAPRKAFKSVPHLNLIDHLTFDVAETEKERVLKDMERRRQKAGTYDRDLSQYWLKAKLKTDEEGKIASGRSRDTRTRSSSQAASTLADLLDGDHGLYGQITQILELWKEVQAPGRAAPGSPKEDVNSSTWKEHVHLVYEQFKGIEPKKVDHQLRRRYEEEVLEEHPFAHWALLRASCFYALTVRKQSFPPWAWQVAGNELCILKMLQHKGRVRPMVGQIHELLRVDTKFTKRLLRSGYNDDVLEAAGNDDEDPAD